MHGTLICLWTLYITTDRHRLLIVVGLISVFCIKWLKHTKWFSFMWTECNKYFFVPLCLFCIHKLVHRALWLLICPVVQLEGGKPRVAAPISSPVRISCVSLLSCYVYVIPSWKGFLRNTSSTDRTLWRRTPKGREFVLCFPWSQNFRFLCTVSR